MAYEFRTPNCFGTLNVSAYRTMVQFLLPREAEGAMFAKLKAELFNQA